GRRPRQRMKQRAESDFEEKVKRAVLRLMERGATFSALDVSESIAPIGDRASDPNDVAHVREVARIMKRLFDEGQFRRFGYKRTLVQDRTESGVMTTVAFSPARKRAAIVVKLERERVRSSIKRHAEEARPFAYLGLGLRDARRLERQTQAIRAQAATSG